MDVKGPGDAADGISVSGEFSGEFLLIGQYFFCLPKATPRA